MHREILSLIDEHCHTRGGGQKSFPALPFLELGTYKMLLDSIADGLPKWYRQWKPALDEHIVRAVTIRLTAKYRGDDAAAKALAREVEWGFAYDLLREKYEPNRDRYQNFAAFFPEVVDLIATLARAHENNGIH